MKCHDTNSLFNDYSAQNTRDTLLRPLSLKRKIAKTRPSPNTDQDKNSSQPSIDAENALYKNRRKKKSHTYIIEISVIGGPSYGSLTIVEQKTLFITIVK